MLTVIALQSEVRNSEALLEIDERCTLL